MESKSLNRGLGAAKAAKQDEFYTQLVDIEAELRHYKDQLRGKVRLLAQQIEGIEREAP